MKQEITVREAIKLTGYTRQHIYNIIVNGWVPSRKEGHEYRLDRNALLSHRRKSPKK